MMSQTHYNIPLLPFQSKIQHPFKGDSNLLGQARLILELLGASNDDLSVLENDVNPEEDSFKIKIWPDSGYSDLVSNNEESFAYRLTKLNEKISNPKGLMGKQIREINKEIRRIRNKQKDLEEVSCSQPLDEGFYNDFLAKRRESAQNLTKNTYEIQWQPTSDKGNVIAKATGATEIEAIIQGTLDVDDIGYSTHHFLIPASEPNENLKKKYSWHFMEKSYSDLDSDSALSILLALQLLDEQEPTAILKKVITTSQLSSYFYTYSFELDQRDGKDETKIKKTTKSTRFHMYSRVEMEGVNNNSIIRVKLGGKKNQFATKKMHSDDKRLGDIDYVAFNLAIIASHTDGIFFTLKIPNNDMYMNENGGTYIHAPRYWNNLLKSGAYNVRSKAWEWYARGELKDAIIRGKYNNSSTIFDYQMYAPIARGVERQKPIEEETLKL